MQRGHHARNHSELLQAQFKKESSLVDLGVNEVSQNDKFNIDGNDGIGDITSSSEDNKKSKLNEQKSPKSLDLDQAQNDSNLLQSVIGE